MVWVDDVGRVVDADAFFADDDGDGHSDETFVTDASSMADCASGTRYDDSWTTSVGLAGTTYVTLTGVTSGVTLMVLTIMDGKMRREVASC